jgi:hypothetical protein
MFLRNTIIRVAITSKKFQKIQQEEMEGEETDPKKKRKKKEF